MVCAGHGQLVIAGRCLGRLIGIYRMRQRAGRADVHRAFLGGFLPVRGPARSAQVDDFQIAPVALEVFGHQAAVAAFRRILAAQQAGVGD